MGKTIYELRTKNGSTFVRCEPTIKESIVQMAIPVRLVAETCRVAFTMLSESAGLDLTRENVKSGREIVSQKRVN